MRLHRPGFTYLILLVAVMPCIAIVVRNLRGPNDALAVRLALNCNGINDTQYIQDIINRYGGKRIQLDGGSKPCRLGQPLVIPPHTALTGGLPRPLFRPMESNISAPMLFALSSFTELREIILDGGGSQHMNSNNVVQAYDVRDIIIDSLEISHTRGAAILISNSSNINISSNIFLTLGMLGSCRRGLRKDGKLLHYAVTSRVEARTLKYLTIDSLRSD